MPQQPPTQPSFPSHHTLMHTQVRPGPAAAAVCLQQQQQPTAASPQQPPPSAAATPPAAPFSSSRRSSTASSASRPTPQPGNSPPAADQAGPCRHCCCIRSAGQVCAAVTCWHHPRGMDAVLCVPEHNPGPCAAAAACGSMGVPGPVCGGVNQDTAVCQGAQG